MIPPILAGKIYHLIEDDVKSKELTDAEATILLQKLKECFELKVISSLVIYTKEGLNEAELEQLSKDAKKDGAN